jgi:hypothetical protein
LEGLVAKGLAEVLVVRAWNPQSTAGKTSGLPSELLMLVCFNGFILKYHAFSQMEPVHTAKSMFLLRLWTMTNTGLTFYAYCPST